MTWTPTNRKNAIRAVIAIVVLLDIILIGVNWSLASAPHPSNLQVKLLDQRRSLIAADVRRAEDIRKSLPAVETDTNTFYQKDLRPGTAGYSSVVEDLGKLAKDSHLQITSTRFRPKVVEKRGVQEITVTITTQGQYADLVSFINSLERSGSFFLLDSLSLESSSEGGLKLNMELRTYFRS
jgi:Tfp pilus assembly protein PilO